MNKQMIQIAVPNGFKATGEYRQPKLGELYLHRCGGAAATCITHTGTDKLPILKRLEPEYIQFTATQTTTAPKGKRWEIFRLGDGWKKAPSISPFKAGNTYRRKKRVTPKAEPDTKAISPDYQPTCYNCLHWELDMAEDPCLKCIGRNNRTPAAVAPIPDHVSDETLTDIIETAEDDPVVVSMASELKARRELEQ